VALEDLVLDPGVSLLLVQVDFVVVWGDGDERAVLVPRVAGDGFDAELVSVVFSHLGARASTGCC